MANRKGSPSFVAIHAINRGIGIRTTTISYAVVEVIVLSQIVSMSTIRISADQCSIGQSNWMNRVPRFGIRYRKNGSEIIQ